VQEGVRLLEVESLNSQIPFVFSFPALSRYTVVVRQQRGDWPASNVCEERVCVCMWLFYAACATGGVMLMQLQEHGAEAVGTHSSWRSSRFPISPREGI